MPSLIGESKAHLSSLNIQKSIEDVHRLSYEQMFEIVCQNSPEKRLELLDRVENDPSISMKISIINLYSNKR